MATIPFNCENCNRIEIVYITYSTFMKNIIEFEITGILTYWTSMFKGEDQWERKHYTMWERF